MSFIGKNIKKLRSVKKLSQAKFAELFDLKRGAVGAYEEERSEPKLDTLIKIANYFSILVDDLISKELTVNELSNYAGNVIMEGQPTEEMALDAIPFIPADAYESFLQNHSNPFFLHACPTLRLPHQTDKVALAVEVNDLSMSHNPSRLFPKDVVIGEKVKQFDNFKAKTLGFVVAKDALLIRHISFLNETELLLETAEQVLPPTTLQLEEVISIWQITAVLKHEVEWNLLKDAF